MAPSESELHARRVRWTFLFAVMFAGLGFLYGKAGGRFSLSPAANAIILAVVGGILICLRFGLESEYR